jgi:hypothetical protein
VFPARQLALKLEAAAVSAAALLSAAFYLRLPGQLPTDADYESAAAQISREATADDAVLLDPHWAERARLFVEGVDVLNLGRDPRREDLQRFRRIFVLSLPRLPRSDPAKTFEFLESIQYRKAEGPVAHGALSVAVFENGEVERALFDFTGRVAEARVYIRRSDGSEEACPVKGNRHPCPRAGWINVGEEIKEINLKPQRCLWAHPAGREPLVIEYPGVTLGRELRVMGGIVGQIAYRRERYSAVALEVLVDGKREAEMSFPPGEPGERYRVIDTSRMAGTEHTVRFEVSAPDPAMRHFCFDAGTYR